MRKCVDLACSISGVLSVCGGKMQWWLWYVVTEATR